MQNFKTKHALLMSVISIILCMTMLVGSTFAWFTDKATTETNSIVAGNLDISLEMLNDAGEWVDAEGTTLDFIDMDNNDLWEPGCTYSLPKLRISNDGNLAVKYELVVDGIDATDGLNAALEWAIDGDVEGTLSANADTNEIAISAHMKEEAGNEFQGLTMDGVTITVYATQATEESDSTTNQYDKDAAFSVSTAARLQEAMNEGKAVQIDGAIDVAEPVYENEAYSLKYALIAENDITASGDDAVIKDTTDGYCGMYVSGAEIVDGITLKSNSRVAFDIYAKDKALKISNVGVEAENSAFYIQGSTAGVILENVNATATGTSTNPAWAQGVVFATNAYDGNSSTVTIKSGSYTATEPDGVAVWSFHGSTVTIEGGTFVGALKVDNGGKIIIKGGTFNVDPTAFVADGYTVTSNGGLFTVVAE